MWCALFFAIGIVLIVLGIETLVVGRFAISNEGKVQQALAKLFGDEQNPGSLANSSGGFSSNVAPPQYTNYNAYGGTVGQSRYGQSSFSNFGNDQFFNRNSNSNSSPGPNSGFSLAGFGKSDRGAADRASRLTNGTARIIRTREWMPWSLVAAGIIVVLYTNSLSRSDFGSGD